MSMLGTKSKPGSEAIRDKNLVYGEHPTRHEDTGTLVPLVSENAVI